MNHNSNFKIWFLLGIFSCVCFWWWEFRIEAIDVSRERGQRGFVCAAVCFQLLDLLLKKSHINKPLCSGVFRGPYYHTCRVLKLVLLEWSESKSDGKLGFSMLKNLPVQIFGAIGATCGIWEHNVIFARWHVHVILRGSTYYNIHYRR